MTTKASIENMSATRLNRSHFKVIKSKKSTKEKIKKWLINHIHPKKRLPILTWLPQYKTEYLKCDIIAGLTVGMVVIPQSLAIAGIYGCPPVFGLYSSFIGPLSSFVFSTSPDVSVGPTLLVALLGSRYNQYGSGVYLSMMSFFSGIVMVLMSFLNAGVLMNLVSFTVLSAFISCGCIAIGVSQLPGWFGIVIKNSGQMSCYQLFVIFLGKLPETNYQDFVIGLSCIIFLLFCHYTMPFVTRRHKDTNSVAGKIIWEIVWMIYVAKNALMTIAMTVIVYLIYRYQPTTAKITLIGKLPAGFPIPWFPIQSANVTDGDGNAITIPALTILSNIYPSFFLAPVMMFVETLSIAKNFSKQKDYYVDSTQELLNVGVANILNSFFRGYPIGGALARSAVNSISGVKTCLSGLISISVVILTLMVLTPAFYYTPKPTLAAMLVAAVIPSINICQVRELWRIQKWEVVPWFGTMFVGLYRLELGMVTGLALSSGFILFREMRPKLHRIHHIHRDRGTFNVRLRSALHYPCAVFITTRIKAFQRRFPELAELEIDCHAMNEIDVTVAKELLYIVEKFKIEQNITVRFTYVTKGSVRHIMTAVGLGPYICDIPSISAADCKHCHSYHNHANFASTDCVEGNIRDNLDTTRSAPIHMRTKLRVIREISCHSKETVNEESQADADVLRESQADADVLRESQTEVDGLRESQTGADVLRESQTEAGVLRESHIRTPVTLAKSVSYSRDVEKDVKRIHLSSSESSSSSSATEDSDMSYRPHDLASDRHGSV